MKIRGFATLAFFGLTFPVLDLFQRTVIVGLGMLRPSRRDRLYARWQRFMAWWCIGSVRRIGGATLDELPAVPGRAGVLVLMNHQSVLDIPIVVASMDGKYPRILTRKRYARGAPVVSHMARLYQYPFIDPRATTRKDIAGLREQAAASAHPFVIFPEGHRSRNGKIGRFKTLGLQTILEARRWSVYVIAVDGFWRWSRLREFGQNLSEMRGRVECSGPFESPEPDADLRPFIDEMRNEMIQMLDAIRGAPVS